MFKFIYRSACASVFLGGWALAGLSLHVVRTPDRLGLIPKERLGITDTYVDARKWTLSDLSAHPDLVKRVLEADKAELFHYLAVSGKGDTAAQLSAAVADAPAQPSNPVMSRINGLFGAAASQTSTVSPNSASFPLDF